MVELDPVQRQQTAVAEVGREEIKASYPSTAGIR